MDSTSVEYFPKMINVSEAEKELKNSLIEANVMRIRSIGRKVFTTDEAVTEWMNTPNANLDGRPPLELLDTNLGAQEVHDLLLGMAHGNIL